jgi:hypothetical protein
MWELGGDSLAFRCRFGHQLSLGGMLAKHGAYRRAKLIEAGRLLAEAAALNRRIAQYAHEQGHSISASRLDLEAAALDQRADDVLRLAATVLVEPTQADRVRPHGRSFHIQRPRSHDAGAARGR